MFTHTNNNNNIHHSQRTTERCKTLPYQILAYLAVALIRFRTGSGNSLSSFLAPELKNILQGRHSRSQFAFSGTWRLGTTKGRIRAFPRKSGSSRLLKSTAEKFHWSQTQENTVSSVQF